MNNNRHVQHRFWSLRFDKNSCRVSSGLCGLSESRSMLRFLTYGWIEGRAKSGWFSICCDQRLRDPQNMYGTASCSLQQTFLRTIARAYNIRTCRGCGVYTSVVEFSWRIHYTLYRMSHEDKLVTVCPEITKI